MNDRYLIAIVYGASWLALGWSCYFVDRWLRARSKRRQEHSGMKRVQQ